LSLSCFGLIFARGLSSHRVDFLASAHCQSSAWSRHPWRWSSAYRCPQLEAVCMPLARARRYCGTSQFTDAYHLPCLYRMLQSWRADNTAFTPHRDNAHTGQENATITHSPGSSLGAQLPAILSGKSVQGFTWRVARSFSCFNTAKEGVESQRDPLGGHLSGLRVERGRRCGIPTPGGQRLAHRGEIEACFMGLVTTAVFIHRAL
jgi:hypothetical protein